jgi:hypothetical protein
MEMSGIPTFFNEISVSFKKTRKSRSDQHKSVLTKMAAQPTTNMSQASTQKEEKTLASSNRSLFHKS